jgi:hypothetical protein
MSALYKHGKIKHFDGSLSSSAFLRELPACSYLVPINKAISLCSSSMAKRERRLERLRRKP